MADTRSRASRRAAANGKSFDEEAGLGSSWRAAREAPWRVGLARLVLVCTAACAVLALAVLLFHVSSCQSPSLAVLVAFCRNDSKVLYVLDTMGFRPKPIHRCPIPLSDDPNRIVIPERSPDTYVKSLSYLSFDELDNLKGDFRLFGGNQSWIQREVSFKLNKSMKIHCGFMSNGGAEMDEIDVNYAKKCEFVVASGIFDGYDIPHQPSNISPRSRKLFCFLMVVDESSLDFISQNTSVQKDPDGGNRVGIWRLVTLHHLPYDEPRRNGKIPKILTHRMFPQARYSIWIDGKMELIVDPLLMLERYLWRTKNTFAVAIHKHHRSIYEEADAVKRRKRYTRPLVDLHMKIYYYEGMQSWSPKKGTLSDVPEGAVLIREHTAMTNLFHCLWFNEVHLFTPRDQLSFGYVAYRLRKSFKLFMFPNCEYNSLFVLHPHLREHSSPSEWVKSLEEFKGKKKGLKESRGGFGLWMLYPGDLNSVTLPPVKRSSPAG